MKVVHILHELKYSGAEIMYVDAAPVFQSLGCELAVVATADNLGEYASSFEAAGYQVYHKPSPRSTQIIKKIAYFKNFIRFLKREQIDVVHVHSSGVFWGMALCAWLAGKRCVYTFHNVFPTNWYSHPYHILQRLTSKHILKCRFQTISDSVTSNELKRFKNKTTKIYNWYGSNRYRPAEPGEKKQARESLGIPVDALVLISVGGCSHIKRHSDILKALPEILKSHPNCIYLHLGTGHIETEEKQLAEELNISSKVRFYGNQKQVRQFLIASDIYLMPSKHEGIPITTIEAMACKIPAILYNVPGLRDFNAEGENSIIIPADHKTLAQSVIKLQNDPAMKDRISSNAYNLVSHKFSMNINAREIFQLYIE